jgi:hypothetical protein
MNKDSAVGFGIGLLSGVVIGGVIALLFAPQSGKETRQMIKEKTFTQSRARVNNFPPGSVCQCCCMSTALTYEQKLIVTVQFLELFDVSIGRINYFCVRYLFDYQK